MSSTGYSIDISYHISFKSVKSLGTGAFGPTAG